MRLERSGASPPGAPLPATLLNYVRRGRLLFELAAHAFIGFAYSLALVHFDSIADAPEDVFSITRPYAPQPEFVGSNEATLRCPIVDFPHRLTVVRCVAVNLKNVDRVGIWRVDPYDGHDCTFVIAGQIIPPRFIRVMFHEAECFGHRMHPGGKQIDQSCIRFFFSETYWLSCGALMSMDHSPNPGPRRRLQGMFSHRPGSRP